MGFFHEKINLFIHEWIESVFNAAFLMYFKFFNFFFTSKLYDVVYYGLKSGLHNFGDSKFLLSLVTSLGDFVSKPEFL